MAEVLKEKAQEGSSYVVVVAFYEKLPPDDTLNPIVPNAGLKWHLKDKTGQIINGRLNQPLDPAEVVLVPLSGLDLSLPAEYPAIRYVQIEGTYDSLYGQNLDLRAQVAFQIENLVG